MYLTGSLFCLGWTTVLGLLWVQCAACKEIPAEFLIGRLITHQADENFIKDTIECKFCAIQTLVYRSYGEFKLRPYRCIFNGVMNHFHMVDGL